MKNIAYIFVVSIVCLFAVSMSQAQTTTSTQKPANTAFDAELAKRLGADNHGMRNYVLVILKTGPKTIPEGKERSEIFKGHFANISRLADEGKLVVAGPFDDKNDWRGMFIFNVENVEDAQKLTATDPVIKSGLMVADYHKLYCSAALMEVGNLHKKIAKESF
jgi:uncharacterized protein YciI